jgi:hypothetical protein
MSSQSVGGHSTFVKKTLVSGLTPIWDFIYFSGKHLLPNKHYLQFLSFEKSSIPFLQTRISLRMNRDEMGGADNFEARQRPLDLSAPYLENFTLCMNIIFSKSEVVITSTMYVCMDCNVDIKILNTYHWMRFILNYLNFIQFRFRPFTYV